MIAHAHWARQFQIVDCLKVPLRTKVQAKIITWEAKTRTFEALNQSGPLCARSLPHHAGCRRNLEA
jgi:hypothetical protein